MAAKTLLIILLLSFCSNLFAAKIWRINKDHSGLHFKISYMSFSEVRGSFNRFSGSLKIEEDGEISALNFSVHIDSIDTNNKLRDGHLKKQDFFYVEKYPYVHFRSQKIELIAPNQYLAHGEIEAKGVKNKLSLKFELSDPKKDTWKYISRFVNFNFTVDRTKIGLDWNKTIPGSQYLIANEVQIMGSLQIQPRSKVTPSSKHMIPNTKYSKLMDKVNAGEMTMEELRQQVKLSKSQETQSIEKLKSNKKKVEQVKALAKTSVINGDRSLKWWISYTLIGLLGFAGMIMLSLKVKLHFKDKTNEHDFSGIATDYLIFPLGFSYAWAMWVIGFAL